MRMQASEEQAGAELEPRARDVLRALQEGIPLEARPFLALARQIGMTEDDLIETVRQLKEQRMIRQISPIYDTRALGYDSALAAFRVVPADIDSAAGVVSGHPGVSHNYERNHEFNLWFTLAVPPGSRLGVEGTVERLARLAGAREQVVFRSTRVFKIGVRLDLDSAGADREQAPGQRSGTEPLTAREREVVRVTQTHLPIVTEPFDGYASELGMSVAELLGAMHDLRERGVMRRFAAILFHRRVGFVANGMSVWQVPKEDAERIGTLFASFKAVSHCYERSASGSWRFNVFAMIHGKSPEDVESTVEQMARESGIREHAVLYSTREFKKRRVEYFTGGIEAWESGHLF